MSGWARDRVSVPGGLALFFMISYWEQDNGTHNGERRATKMVSPMTEKHMSV